MRALEPASLQLRFQARPEVARDLRDRLSIWLEEVGAAGDDVFEVLLAVTEAFANAVEHPREPSSRTIDVDGSIADHTVTVSVRDYGAWQAERQRSEGGLGFLLIGQLMDSVEVRPGARHHCRHAAPPDGRDRPPARSSFARPGGRHRDRAELTGFRASGTGTPVPRVVRAEERRWATCRHS
jgi:anti-sigma regulatory factor (Ser/Thr protein kinase)